MIEGPIDIVQRQWQSERPDLDTSSIGILGRIDRVSKVAQAEGKKVLDALDVNGWEYEVLATLRRTGPDYELTPRDLSETLLVSGSALTNRLDHLERAGYVERRPDLEDRRSIRIRLTKKGHDSANQLVEAYLSREKELLGGLNNREQRTLEGLLRKLLISIEPLAGA